MTSGGAGKTLGSSDASLQSIIETSLTEALVNELFHIQNDDGSFPPTDALGKLFSVDYDQIKQQLKGTGLDSSISDDVHRLISTASVLFYFLYHSQKAKFPVDIKTINQIVSKARSELEGFSIRDDPIAKSYVDKAELAVNYVLATREKYADLCSDLHLFGNSWESYIQHLMGLDKQN